MGRYDNSPRSEDVDRVLSRGTKKKEKSAASGEEKWLADLDALINNPTFRTWFTKVMLAYGGVEIEGAMTDLRQGQAMMLSRLRYSLIGAKSAPRFFAEITEKYWSKITQKEETHE